MNSLGRYDYLVQVINSDNTRGRPLPPPSPVAQMAADRRRPQGVPPKCGSYTDNAIFPCSSGRAWDDAAGRGDARRCTPAGAGRELHLRCARNPDRVFRRLARMVAMGKPRIRLRCHRKLNLDD